MQNELIGNTINAVMNLSFSVVVLFVVFALLFLYAWKTTKGKSVALLISILVSGIFYSSLVKTGLYQSVFSENIQGFVLNTVVFAILLVSTMFVLKSFCRGGYSEDRVKRILQISGFVVVAGGLLMNQAYRLLKVETLYDFSPSVDFVFGNEYSSLIWIVLTLGFLSIIKSRR